MDGHKIIFLIATPRSLSTAFSRMMMQRKDFKLFNEPALSIYNCKHYPGSHVIYQSEHTDYEALARNLLLEVNYQNVFIKEMSYAFEDFILKNLSLLKLKNIHFIFLLRNPHHTVISLFKKFHPDFFLNGSINLNELAGYQSLKRSYELVKLQAKNKPYIIQAESLYQDTETTIKNFCTVVNLDFIPETLAWNNLGNDFNGTAWQENKNFDLMYHWHREAITSTHFYSPTQYDLDSFNSPTFSELKVEAHRQLCSRAYYNNKPFYDFMVNEL